MAQKTNLNISPYFDDFDAAKQFYKILFNPGRPIQARELTTLQSILQNQIESFGSHIFKEGSMVIPGGITFDRQFNAVKINDTNFGVDVALYLDKLIGKKITGSTSGVTATVQYYLLPDGNEILNPTIFVKYLDSDNNFEYSTFSNGESLTCNESIVYGNTTISSGVPFASLINDNSTSIGSAASINDGIYFIRGYFVKVNKETLVLDPYTNNPSYRVGLKIREEIVTPKDDNSLYDNAKGFTNYAAPGAHRFKISVSLTKKSLTDLNDTDFIELLRVGDGEIKKIEVKSQYALLRDYLAERTYDESGDYSVVPFQISVQDSLNDRLGNNGLFFDNETTNDLNTPSDDLMCIKVSPGKAYVKGYDIEKTSTTIIDVAKPREVQTSSLNLPFEMGNTLVVNNLYGVAQNNASVSLYDSLKNSETSPAGTKIGDARVYCLNLTDAAYSGDSTRWNLHLYDVQTYTTLTLNQALSSIELPATSYIQGKSSGASGYAVTSGAGSSVINLRQTSGTFIVGENLIINGVEKISRSIASIRVYSSSDIRSVYQAANAGGGFPTAFTANAELYKKTAPGFSGLDRITITAAGTVTASGKYFSGISTGSIIRYQVASDTLETFNKVAAINSTGSSMALVGINSTVSGIFKGDLPATTVQVPFSLGESRLLNENKGFLYAQFPNENISSVNLSDSLLPISYQITGESTSAGGVLVFNDSQISGISSSYFQNFDEERYSVHYSDGSIQRLTQDQFVLSGNIVTITGLTANQTDVVVNVSLIKNGIQSKVKNYSRSQVVNINYSKYTESGTGISTSINDGLTYNPYYGLRVQDERICLNYPDVANIICVYESLDSNSPVLDTIQFSSTANVSSNAIIGENIIGSTSGCVARVVTKPSTNVLGVVYLNQNRFSKFENVSFEESNISTEIEVINLGSYKNITRNFNLDKGQKDQYYDYSSLVRNRNSQEPSKKILVVLDYYTVPSSDSGDLFTVLSYQKERYASDIPLIGQNRENFDLGIRASDVLDFRPRVSTFVPASATASPFDFSSRSFGTEPKYTVAPNENCLVSYDFYLGRIDKLYLDKSGNLLVNKGISSIDPKAPTKIDDVMELATITLPPYLYSPTQAVIDVVENKRYTMRDIGKIEDRVETLEKVTSLSLLEVSTQTLQIQDADGLNRFKTGFFVDDFKNTNFIDSFYSSVEVDSGSKVLRPIVSKNTLKSQIAPKVAKTDEELDLSTNFELLDTNVKKSDQVITLNYKEIGWIEQPLATKVENVNPFHVVLYAGNVALSPSSDNWIRTIRLPERILTSTRWQFVGTTGRWAVVGSSTQVSSVDVLISSGADAYMRSRNTQFSATNLKPLTRFYQFFDNNSAVDFVPKLLEIASDSSLQNYGSSSSFQVGETVFGYVNGVRAISFRVATPNHKYGPYNAPTTKFNINPYVKTENLSDNYSTSSKVLNIDTFSLSEEAQGKYSGYVSVGMKLIGQTSGSVAYIKDLRLISDNYGDLIGTFFLKDPNTNPPPSVRIGTGTKTYKITSSPTNAPLLPGSKLISSAETTYKSEGVVEVRELNTTITNIIYFVDPLAQSFTVGNNFGEAPDANGSNEDANGCFLTSVDLFFANKDPGNAPLTVEIRTVEFGTPTRTILGKPKVLRPDDITVSDTGDVATNVKFDYPIYLAPGQQYAVVLLAPETDQYEVWIAEMGEKTVNTKTLPNAESVRYTRQFAIGRLYKSQNGAEWTANDYQDMKFKLYKAEFTSTQGTAYFYNPTLDDSNTYVNRLFENPLFANTRKLTVGITTVTSSSMIGILTTGRKVGESTKTYNYGYIVGTGASVTSVGITTVGSNYVNGTSTNVSTLSLNGSGTGLVLDLTVSSGKISSAAIVSGGNGYKVGDVVGIVTSTAGGTGEGAQITISTIGGVDTLYLDSVQGESFSVGSQLRYYNNGSPVSLGSTLIRTSSSFTNQDSGNYLRVRHFDHGMYSKNNKVQIFDAGSSEPLTLLTSDIVTSTSTISIANTSVFSSFEGVSVGSSNPGYIKIENEIIKYESVGNGTLETITRGIDSTISVDHSSGTQVEKYELNGVSLRRINTTHDISDLLISIDGYFLEIDRSINGTNRSTDGSLTGSSQLSFNTRGVCGGVTVKASENIQYDTVIPNYNILTPGSTTSVTAAIRTVSGTSVNGSESSFQDLGYESVQLNTPNRLSSTRIVCSKINELTYLGSLPRNKSFTTTLDLSTSDKNLSPIIFCDTAFTEFRNNLLDQPVTDYINDRRINSYQDDPHGAIYVSNEVKLEQPASSLKVILTASRPSSSDFRVLYSLTRPDSSEVAQSFELFPGYDNLTTDLNLDGYLDIINPSKNSGRPDVFVPPSLEGQFLEYNYTASNLGLFTGYRIKIIFSGTNQATPPLIKDIRTIALA